MIENLVQWIVITILTVVVLHLAARIDDLEDRK